MLVLTHEANRAHRARLHEGVTIVSVDELAGHLLALTPSMTAAEVETTTGRLMTLIPPVGAPAASEAPPGAEPARTSFGQGLYRRFNVYYYVQPWSRAGRRRLYLNDETGATVAYKDLVTGVVAVTDPEVGDHLRPLLQNASASSLGLTKATVPKVPSTMPAGRFVSSMTRLWTTFHIGYRWRKGALDRLYCVRANPQEGVDELGYIDLTTGHIHPVHDHPLGKDLGTPPRYLELHRERYRPRI